MLDNKLIQISAIVIIGHLMVLGSAFFHFWPEYEKSVQPRKLAVQTISLQKALAVANPSPAKPVPAAMVPSTPVKPPPPAKIVKKPPEKIVEKPAPVVKKPAPAVKKLPPPPKKEEIKAPVIKKTVKPEVKAVIPKPPPPPENTPLANLKEKQQALLAARENIAKIQLKSDKVSATKQLTSNLTKVESLHIDQLEQVHSQESSAVEATYQEELAYFLKQHLHLVEVGDVKIKLTLSKKGEVVHFSIVYAESRLNRELIEKEIHGLHFPAWDQRLSSQLTYSCCVTLSHDQLSSY